MTRESWRRRFFPSSIETRKRRTRDGVTSGLIDVGGGGCGGFGGGGSVGSSGGGECLSGPN